MKKEDFAVYSNNFVYALHYRAGMNEDTVTEFVNLFDKCIVKRENPQTLRITLESLGMGGILVNDGDFVVYTDDKDVKPRERFSTFAPVDFHKKFSTQPPSYGCADNETDIFIPGKAMTMEEFFYYTESTALSEDEVGMKYPLFTALGMAGECGEYANKIKKLYRDDKGVLSEDLRKHLLLELGDVLWYVAEAARSVGSDIETVAKLNIEKVVERFKNGTIHGDGDDR